MQVMHEILQILLTIFLLDLIREFKVGSGNLKIIFLTARD